MLLYAHYVVRLDLILIDSDRMLRSKGKLKPW